jgi:hypothetical protein
VCRFRGFDDAIPPSSATWVSSGPDAGALVGRDRRSRRYASAASVRLGAANMTPAVQRRPLVVATGCLKSTTLCVPRAKPRPIQRKNSFTVSRAHREARSITAVEMGDSEFEYSDEEYGNVVNSSLQQAQVRARPTRPQPRTAPARRKGHPHATFRPHPPAAELRPSRLNRTRRPTLTPLPFHHRADDPRRSTTSRTMRSSRSRPTIQWTRRPSPTRCVPRHLDPIPC